MFQIKSIFEKNWNKPFLLKAESTDQWTYGETLNAAAVYGERLRARGLKPQAKILVSFENSVEGAFLYLAGLLNGFTFVPVNPQNEKSVVETLVSENKFDLILMDAQTHQHFTKQGMKLGADAPAIVVMGSDVGFDTSIENRRLSVQDISFYDFGDQDFLVMYSSGTSGKPKGIRIPLKTMAGNGSLFTQTLGLQGGRFYNVLPMTYLGGAYNLLLIPLLAEGSTVIDNVFGPQNIFRFWETVRERKIDILWLNATMQSMLMSIQDDDVSFLKDQIRIGLCGMAPLPVELKKKFETRFQVPLYENYALSETLFLTSNRPDLPYKDGSNGPCLKGVKLLIVDENQNELPAGQEGEIKAVTPFLMNGYINADAGDIEKIQPDGFLTGDIGKFDESGELFVTGRKKEIIIRGGVNIGPKAIEDVIHQVPGVQDVAVVGVPHAIYGEEVEAALMVKPGFDRATVLSDVKKHCTTHLAQFKRPKKFHLYEDLPRGNTGKVLKRVIRDRLTTPPGANA